jgi:hypothetical protein
MRLSEKVIGEELDRVIHSAVLRIEQQRLHVQQSAASHWQIAEAQHALDAMIAALRQLRLRRAQFS